MSTGRFFIQLPSACGMCFLLVLAGWILWLIYLKIIKWTVAKQHGILDLHAVQIRWKHRAFLRMWCGYQYPPNSACRYHYTSFLKELKNMMTRNETSPGLQFGIRWGSSRDSEVRWGCSGGTGSSCPLALAGWVPRLQCAVLAVMPQRRFACLLLSGSKMYYSLLLFLYTLHRVETKIRYKQSPSIITKLGDRPW